MSSPGVFYHYKKLKKMGYLTGTTSPKTIVKVWDRYFYLWNEVIVSDALVVSEHEIKSEKRLEKD